MSWEEDERRVAEIFGVRAGQRRPGGPDHNGKVRTDFASSNDEAFGVNSKTGALPPVTADRAARDVACPEVGAFFDDMRVGEIPSP